MYGAVGMTDFAYRKRKILERLKDWWKRQSMQGNLGLKRNRCGRNVANGDADLGYDVLI